MTDLNIITVSDIAAFAPEINTAQFTPATISGMITQASKVVSDYLQYTPLAEDIVNELVEARITTDGDLLIFPTKIPVQSVSAISIVKGSTAVALTLSNGADTRYNIDYTKRTIRYPHGELAYTGNVAFTDLFSLRGTQFYTRISYRGGFEASELPATIQLATIEVLRDLLSRGQNSSGATRISQGQISLEFDSKQGSIFLAKAKKLLNPYRRI